MWKKFLPLIGLSGILLVGCNNNGKVPNNNETPMQDVREDVDQWKNNVEKDIDNNGVNNGNGNDNDNVNDNGTNNNRNGNNLNDNDNNS